MYDMLSYRLRATLRGHQDSVRDLQWVSFDGLSDRVVSVCRDGELRIWAPLPSEKRASEHQATAADDLSEATAQPLPYYTTVSITCVSH